ncbi:MAG TPA: four helix bundle protein [Candidatus Paceibacterota bacterium]|nr:four helix bundle protein [Candidatus Paceibacterota bacterium]
MNESPGKIKNFTDLIAWQEAQKLALGIYKITAGFPKDEQYSLVNQMRRAAVSITSNIAEGFSRNSYKEKIQFYSIAQGSVTELQSQLLISKDLYYISINDFEKMFGQSTSTHKIINGLIKGARKINND